MRIRRRLPCLVILLTILILACDSGLVLGQGGTGKLPPLGRSPIGRPPPRNPPVSKPEIDYLTSFDKTALNNGRVAGETSYRGPAPKRLRIDTSTHPVCSKLKPRLEI